MSTSTVGMHLGSSPLLKVLLPVVALALVAIVIRTRRLSWREDAGFGPARFVHGAPVAVAYIAWMLVTNAVMDWRGPWDFSPWRSAPLLTNVARILGVCLLGPLAEEVLFRGLLFARIARKQADIRRPIIATAALWSVIHYAYAPPVIAVLFVAGLLLGLARHRTGAIWVPLVMHITWNLYAVW